MGAKFPQAIMDSFYALGESGSAKELLDTFTDTISGPNVFDMVSVTLNN
ncbi:hypothetical protein SCARD494_11338 [Seiridium cardinale]